MWVSPLRLALGGLRLFPSAARPRVLSVDLEPEEPLRELARSVEHAVQAVGLPPEERPFRAHLTLARLADGLPAALRPRKAAPEGGRREPAERATLPEPPVPRVELPVEEVVLFESRLGPEGAVYRPLVRVPLAGAGTGAESGGEAKAGAGAAEERSDAGDARRGRGPGDPVRDGGKGTENAGSPRAEMGTG